MSMIEAKDLSFAYGTGKAVTNLNFCVGSGDYLCIVGENGSGKSTLLKGLLGLKKPQSGSLTFSEGLKQTQMGYLPQQSTTQKDFPASVWEVVLSGTHAKGHILSPRYSKQQRELARHWLSELNILDMANRAYSNLSGGQQQRVLLARALCATGRVLLLDEPVSGLDPLVTQEMYSILRSLNQKNGLTVIMISHDIKSAVREASHILQLHTAQQFFGTTEEYMRSPVGMGYLCGDYSHIRPQLHNIGG